MPKRGRRVQVVRKRGRRPMWSAKGERIVAPMNWPANVTGMMRRGIEEVG